MRDFALQQGDIVDFMTPDQKMIIGEEGCMIKYIKKDSQLVCEAFREAFVFSTVHRAECLEQVYLGGE